jgi:NADH:ubiquinone oxidoreductase subunit F (NADH-binding)
MPFYDRLLPESPLTSLDGYRATGGGAGLEALDQMGPQAALDVLRASGIRGRGGAGFPTALKWSGMAAAEADRKFVVANVSEGEPGTFKDRWLIHNNPYQLLEGLTLASRLVGAEQAFIGIKYKYEHAIDRLERAAVEMVDAGMIGDPPITIVRGPDVYLFGEEKAMLEVIEGNDPKPRLYPPYIRGLFESQNSPLNPTSVNNAETLSHVPRILARGAEWFRSLGTKESPGTMIFALGGDSAVNTVVELPLGTPMRELVETWGGGTRSGRPIKMITNGVSNRPLGPQYLDTPLSYEGMKAVGAGLGSAGFTLYDDTICPVQVMAAYAAFNARGSCGQCMPCKVGTTELARRLIALAEGRGGVTTMDQIGAWVARVTDWNRCGLGAGQQALIGGFVEEYPEDIAVHLGGEPCVNHRRVDVPAIEDWDPATGRFSYYETSGYAEGLEIPLDLA